MSLGMELGLGSADFVLDGDPASFPQIFGPCLLWSNGWTNEAGTWHGGRSQPRQLCVTCLDEDAVGTEVDLGSGHIVLDGVPAPAKGAEHPPFFRPMSILATVAHLSYC